MLLTTPGRTAASIRGADFGRSGLPARPAPRLPGRPGAFFSRFASRPPRPGSRPARRWYIRRAGRRRRPDLANRLAPIPQGVACRCPRTQSPPLPGASSAPSSGERSASPTYEIWLEPLELLAIREGKLLVEAPPATESWVAKRFGRILESCARLVFGSEVEVELSSLGRGVARPGRTVDRPEVVLDLDAGALNPRYSFEQFIIGDGNRLAHAASLAVAELPGQAYNPLFLHAPPGLGKTHLLHAIGNYVRAFGGGTRVRYTTVETFTNQFIRALGSRSLDRFKQAYRDADVLLIDDVQFLASKAKTEEEFFHTFNALYETGRQLVLTCDRLPRQLISVEERLRERFESASWQ